MIQKCMIIVFGNFRTFSLAGSPVIAAPKSSNLINFALKDGQVILMLFTLSFPILIYYTSLNFMFLQSSK